MIETFDAMSRGRTLNLKKGLTFKIMLVLLGLFLLLRLPGIFLPYHQDEWKNVSAAATVERAGSFFAHPPLMQMMFVAAHKMFGADYFRILPLLFALASAGFLYLVVWNRDGKKAALWSTTLYATSFYAVLGSLVPDVDGAILPFFFLLTIYLYDRWADSKKLKWFLLLVSSLITGFLIKLSFVLVVGTLVVDYLIEHWRSVTFRKATLGIAVLAGFSFFYIALLYLIRFAYPAFDIGIMFGHANQFADNIGRNWIQVIVQGMKAIFYLSPLFLVPFLFINQEIFKKTRIFFVYLILGFIFYFVLFDFSRGALDKYLMFAVIPLATIGGVIFGDIFNSSNKVISKKFLFISLGVGAVISAFLWALNFMSHSVVPLYPKEEWFNRVLHFDWKVLNPFNGGSGPLGFYVSFLFIAASFIVSITLSIIGIFKKEWRRGLVVILVMIGVTYNLVFVEELMFGKINGNAPKVMREAISFITDSEEIKNVLTYNDIGNHELSAIGKYAGRIYATPQSEAGYKKKFTEFDGQYLIVEIPRLSGFYREFFEDCQTLFETSSGKITGRVFDCPQNQ